MENDINVISAAAAMFSGTRNPLPWVSTLYDFGKHHNAQTANSNNSETETDIDAISKSIPMFFGGGFFIGLYANLTRRFLHAEVQHSRRIPEVVIIW